jgi:hypothetical protein
MILKYHISLANVRIIPKSYPFSKKYAENHGIWSHGEINKGMQKSAPLFESI